MEVEIIIVRLFVNLRIFVLSGQYQYLETFGQFTLHNGYFKDDMTHFKGLTKPLSS